MSLPIARRDPEAAGKGFFEEGKLRAVARECLPKPVLGGFLSAGQSEPQERRIEEFSGTILGEAVCLAILGSDDPKPVHRAVSAVKILVHREAEGIVRQAEANHAVMASEFMDDEPPSAGSVALTAVRGVKTVLSACDGALTALQKTEDFLEGVRSGPKMIREKQVNNAQRRREQALGGKQWDLLANRRDARALREAMATSEEACSKQPLQDLAQLESRRRATVEEMAMLTREVAQLENPRTQAPLLVREDLITGQHSSATEGEIFLRAFAENVQIVRGVYNSVGGKHAYGLHGFTGIVRQAAWPVARWAFRHPVVLHPLATGLERTTGLPVVSLAHRSVQQLRAATGGISISVRGVSVPLAEAVPIARNAVEAVHVAADALHEGKGFHWTVCAKVSNKVAFVAHAVLDILCRAPAEEGKTDWRIARNVAMGVWLGTEALQIPVRAHERLERLKRSASDFLRSPLGIAPIPADLCMDIVRRKRGTSIAKAAEELLECRCPISKLPIRDPYKIDASQVAISHRRPFLLRVGSLYEGAHLLQWPGGTPPPGCPRWLRFDQSLVVPDPTARAQIDANLAKLARLLPACPEYQ